MSEVSIASRLQEIIAATGVRPSTIYEYFSNKDQIVWALVEEYFTQSHEGLLERYEKGQRTNPSQNCRYARSSRR